MSKKNYTYKEATPEQIKEWNDTELKWWGDHSMMIIIIASASIFGLIAVSYTHLTLPTIYSV